MKPLRSLPRAFVNGATPDGPIELPADELNKFTRVLRLTDGDEVAILPNDGRLIRGTLQGKTVVPVSIEHPNTESQRRLTLLQALPKGDKPEEIVQAGTELGVYEFVFFASDRSVVKWEGEKVQAKLKRLQIIAREAAEQSYRTRIPAVSYANDVFKTWPQAYALSESDQELRRLPELDDLALLVGPEGGWSPAEMQKIGERGITLGPRVLRTEHAGAAAAALYLLG
jgi:16S rRNA (uracil1498-N3)-methyltransferase